MKKIFTALFSIIALHGTCLAVDFAPIGAKWIYEFDSQRAPMKYSIGTITYEVTKDTIIGDIGVRKIEGVEITPYMNKEQTAILRDTTDCAPIYAYNEGSKAYLSTDGGKSFNLYFDYSLSEGEKIKIGPFPGCNATTIEIDSIKRDENDNKIFYFDECMDYPQFILEQGGSLYGLWPVTAMMTGGGSWLKSYESGATKVDITSSNGKEVSIYPNPVSNELNIFSSTEVERIEIYDSKGAIVAKENGKKVCLNSLPHGVYSAVIILKDGSKIMEQFIR